MATNKVVIWDDKKTKLEIMKRFKSAAEQRKSLEDNWRYAERILFQQDSIVGLAPYLEDDIVGEAPPDAPVSYVMRNVQLIHSQMSSNPPTVTIRPITADQNNHRRAEAADKVAMFALRKYALREKIDRRNLNTITYGTGITKTIWDASAGEIMDYDPKTGDVTMEGDIKVTIPSIWNIYLDPDAKSADEIKWVIERLYIDLDEAMMLWPTKADVLKAAVVGRGANNEGPDESKIPSNLRNARYNVVELLEYWEDGLPTNAYLGRYAITTRDGEVVESCKVSPHRFHKAGQLSKIESQENISDEMRDSLKSKLVEQASLPYTILTDIDVPDQIYGRSHVDYSVKMQDTLIRLDASTLDNIKSHGADRLVIPETAELADDGITDIPTKVMKIAGNQGPYFIKPPEMMPEMSVMRNSLITGIDAVWGVNESMLGVQSRETSGSALTSSVNFGNTIRRRLFNKYALVTELEYKCILNLAARHWSTDKIIHVLGKEKALEAYEIKGLDLDGGFDLVADYGVNLSLDPNSARQEIITMMPFLEKAGVQPRSLLRHLRLSELDSIYDELEMAKNRQMEVFSMMIASGQYIAPEELQDHENMIQWALQYFMTTEFTQLDPQLKNLCRQHIKDRVKLAAQEKTAAGSQAAPQAAPAAAAPQMAPAGYPGTSAAAPAPIPSISQAG